MRATITLTAVLLVACATEGSSSTDGTHGDASATDSSSGSSSVGSGTTDSTSDEPTTSSGGSSSGSQPQTTGDDATLDDILLDLLDQQEVPVVPLQPPPASDPAVVALGEALFFDPILSGNKDIACASCHHPAHGTSDGLSLTLGTGAVGVGPQRAEGSHPPFIARHSQSLFNVGYPEFRRMFWDGRIEEGADGELRTPAGDDLLPGVQSPLAAQAMFPVLDRAEMRGEPSDLTVLGEVNELAALPDDDPAAVWAAIMARLGEIQEYRDLFAAAYPGRPFEDLNFADAANAIAAYERDAFSYWSTPWDAYLAGELDAISDAAKLGATLFYGSARCSKCHAGPQLTDHKLHNTAIPQLGPGHPQSAPFDYGRELVTSQFDDRFRFRTPSLRNVEVSAPYMHDGAHLDFEDLVVHYADPELGIANYDSTGLHPDLVDTVQRSPEHIEEITGLLDPDLITSGNFAGLSNIREFLLTLTDPAVFDLPNATPASVPSGLDVP